jgi:hypothetical protein
MKCWADLKPPKRLKEDAVRGCLQRPHTYPMELLSSPEITCEGVPRCFK